MNLLENECSFFYNIYKLLFLNNESWVAFYFYIELNEKQTNKNCLYSILFVFCYLL